MDNTTVDLEKMLESLRPDPGSNPTTAFRTNARIRILNRIAQTPEPLRSPAPHPFRAIYALRLAILILFFAGGTVFAAQSSLPKDALFPVKVLSERVALTLSPTQTIKTTVANAIIGRRAMEIEATKQDGNTEEVRQTISQYESTVSEIRSNKEVDRNEIEREVSKHEPLIRKLDDHKSPDDNDRLPPNPSPKPDEDDKPEASPLEVPLLERPTKESLDRKDSGL